MTDPLEALLQARETVSAEVEGARSRLHAIGVALEAYMKESGAQERTVNGWKVTYKQPTVWDKSRLIPLLEAIPLEQLIEAKAYTPEHTVVAPAAFDMTRTKPFARYSAEAKAIIESAQSLGIPELRIERMKP